MYLISLISLLAAQKEDNDLFIAFFKKIKAVYKQTCLSFIVIYHIEVYYFLYSCLISIY